jgi:succinoglycan biosynthesis transport protein ExoP
MARSTVDVYEMEDGDLDLRSLGAALWRRKFWIIVPTLIAAIGAGVVVNLLTPRYKSEARIVYDGRENVFLRPEAEKAQQERAPADAEALADQVQIVMSRELALGVIADLKLNELPEFDPVLRNPSVLRRVLSTLGVTRDYLAMTPEERVLEAWYDRLTAFSPEKSRVIVIEFQSADPVLAAKITNAIAADYLRRQQLVRQEQTRGASVWLANEIEKLRPKVADAEAKAEAFRGDTNLMVGTNNTTLSAQQLGEFNTQLVGARSQRAEAETRARIIREMLKLGGPIESSDIVNSELIRRLSEQRVILRGQLAEQSSTLLGGHPRIKELRAQIADLDQQIRSEADKLARTFDNDARIATARMEAMSANLDAVKKQAAASNEQDVQYRALEREAKAQRDLLESYLAKYRESTARETIGSAPPDAKIISAGIVSNTPAFPRKVPIIAVATLLAFALSVGLVTTGELMRAMGPSSRRAPASYPVSYTEPRRDPLRDPMNDPMGDPPARRSKTKIAEPAPEIQAPETASIAQAPERIVVAAPEQSIVPETTAPAMAGEEMHESPAIAPDPAADDAEPPAVPHPVLGVSFRAVRDVAARLRENADIGHGVVLFAVRPELATTLPALTLARALSTDSRVVMVGLVKRAPVLEAIATPPHLPGLSDVVRGMATFGQIVGKDRLSGVHLVRYGRSDMSMDTLLGAGQFGVLMEALSRAYAHVIIDAGPLSDHAFLLAAVAPRAVLIAGDGAPEEIAGAVEMLTGAGFADIAVMSAGVTSGAAPGLAAA